MTMTDSVAVQEPEKKPDVKAAKKKKAKPCPKVKTKSKAKPRPKVKAKKKGAAFTWKGPGGARERKKLGIHLLIIRVSVSTVKRIDAKLKKAGRARERGAWCADVLTKAAKR